MHKGNTHIEVWDPLLRSFHWLLVVTFTTAWWSEGRDIQVHLIAGSIVPGLLLFRLIWGIAGEHHARFSSFLPSLRTIRQHIGELLHLHARRYTGHTPIGSVMIYLLLISLLILSLSGMLLMALQMGIGVFSAWGVRTDFATEVLVQQVHYCSFVFLQYLIVIHLGGVAVESLLQKSNLTAAMLSGNKPIKEAEQ